MTDNVETEGGVITQETCGNFKRKFFLNQEIYQQQCWIKMEYCKRMVIKTTALEAYKYRLRNRQIKPGLEPLQQLKENICNMRLKKA